MKTLTSNVAYAVMLVLIAFVSLAAIQFSNTTATSAHAADPKIAETEAEAGGEAEVLPSPELLGHSTNVTYAGCVPGSHFGEPLY